MKRINSMIAIVLLMALASGCANSMRPVNAEVTAGTETTREATTEAASETTAETTDTTTITSIVITADTAEETETTTKASETTVKVTPKEPVIKFSGKAKDVITLKADSYYEGDKFFIFAQKGARLRGDVAKNISVIMDDLEKLFNMSYKKTEYTFEDDWKDYLFGGSFKGINKDMEKVSIVILKDPKDKTIETAFGNETTLFDTDLDSVKGSYGTVYHELAHVLRLRQGENLSSVIEEGVALYAQDKLSRKYKKEDWEMIQYVNCYGFSTPYSDKNLKEDPEKEFINAATGPRSSEQPEYQYGIRFVYFLTETYGKDVIKKISETSRKYEFAENGTGTDIDTVIKVIKEATSQDVFTRFKKWVPGGWKKYCKSYLKYMKKFGA